jgi:Uma2 family endonuclease
MLVVEMSEALLLPSHWLWTFADLKRFPDDGNRYEIIDGSLLVSPAPPKKHQSVASNLIVLLHAAAPADLRVTHGAGVLLNDPDQTQYLIPDVLVVNRATEGAQAYRPGDVHLVIEVVCPSSVTRDRVTKRDVYARLGIPSYWIVETAAPGRVTELRLDETGSYVEVPAAGGAQELRVDRPFDFRVSVETLLA